MKKLILTGLSFLFAITLTFAQQSDVETKAKEVTTELTEKLTLTADQQTAVHTIVLEKIKAKHALKADTTQSAEDVKLQIDAIKNTSTSKIAELLNDDQKAIFIKHLEEKQAKKEEKQ